MMLLRLLFWLLLSLVVGRVQAAGPAEVSEAIRTRLEPYVGRSTVTRISSAAVPQAIVQLYAERNWEPVWNASRLEGLLVELARLEDDGLDPDDYGYGLLRRWGELEVTALHEAERDILATRAYLLALVHVHRGKLEPARIFPQWNLDARNFESGAALEQARVAMDSGSLEVMFERARPGVPAYRGLREALKEYRRIARQGEWPLLPANRVLKPGMKGDAVRRLRERLQQGGLLPVEPGTQDDVFDEAVAVAVRRFQQDVYLAADGVAGRATLAALNVPVRQRINQIKANLERMRWYAPDATRKDFVMVDIPAYRASFFRDGNEILTSRVQVGREYRPTPVFRSEISYITLSPGWVVPPNILKKDVIPEIRKDPGYLARNRMNLYTTTGQRISLAEVDWSRPSRLVVRQEPGAQGALGEVVIRFDNPYMVYLHDTPHQSLFEDSRRATSSGCIRVEKIHELAMLLLDDNSKWSRETLQEVINERKTRNVRLPRRVPVLLAYWTVGVTETGRVEFRPDIYSRDEPIIRGLGLHP